MNATTRLSDEPAVVQRILDHIDHGTTDLGDASWREPVENYRSEERLAVELAVLRRHPTPFCPSAALRETGAYLARDAAGTPLLAVRSGDGALRVFRNACRHRGARLTSGSGQCAAFTCRYHGWTYQLDGRLRHVPHEHGFPGLDKGARGLVPVDVVETRGLVFVTQDAPVPADASPDPLPELIPAGYRLVGCNEIEVPVNWKILTEGFLEGYHIRPTHTRTFYPLQYDNLNVVETFGRNSRIAFPYRAIEKLRRVAPAKRRAEGTLTFVYHLFPNALLATFPGRRFLVVLEPLALDRTRQITWMFSDSDEGDARAQDFLRRGVELVDSGAAEDRDVACAIQLSLASGANEFFEFGLFEKAIVHFHRALHAAIDAHPA